MSEVAPIKENGKALSETNKGELLQYLTFKFN